MIRAAIIAGNWLLSLFWPRYRSGDPAKPYDQTVNPLETDPSLALRYLELLDRMNDWFARTYWQNTATFLAVSFGAPLVLFRDSGLSADHHRWFVVGGSLLAAAVNFSLWLMLWRLGREMDAIVEQKRYAEKLTGANLSAGFRAIRFPPRSRYFMYGLAIAFGLAYFALSMAVAFGVTTADPSVFRK